MKRIQKGELYQHLSEFLKKKGIELQHGPYPGRIEQVCRLLTDTINGTQSTLDRAKQGMDRGFEQVKQALNKKNSPKASPFASAPPKASAETAAKPKAKAKTAAKAKSPVRRNKAAPKKEAAKRTATKKAKKS